jgi:hypothetical protein
MKIGHLRDMTIGPEDSPETEAFAGPGDNESASAVSTDTGSASPLDRERNLMPGEDPDLRREILRVAGEEWLHTKNIWLQGRSPQELSACAMLPYTPENGV